MTKSILTPPGADADDLDRLIDVEARTMTEIAAARNLRTPVLARLGDRRPIPAWRRHGWLVPVAAAAALGAVFIGSHRASRPREIVRPTAAAIHVASAQTSPVAVAETSVVPANGLERVSTPSRERTAAAPAMSAAETEWRARAVPALDALPSLDVAPIQPAPLSIPQLNVQSIVTTPISTNEIRGRDR